MEDEINNVADAITIAAHSITPKGAIPAPDGMGGYVGSLTEAVMSIASAIQLHTKAVEDLADAIRESKPTK